MNPKSKRWVQFVFVGNHNSKHPQIGDQSQTKTNKGEGQFRENISSLFKIDFDTYQMSMKLLKKVQKYLENFEKP